MIKLNFSNLAGRLRPEQPQSGRAGINDSPCVVPPVKPRYSAYRTVIARHEELSRRIDDSGAPSNDEGDKPDAAGA